MEISAKPVCNAHLPHTPPELLLDIHKFRLGLVNDPSAFTSPLKYCQIGFTLKNVLFRRAGGRLEAQICAIKGF